MRHPQSFVLSLALCLGLGAWPAPAVAIVAGGGGNVDEPQGGQPAQQAPAPMKLQAADSAPPKDTGLPVPVRMRLPNGITVLVVERHNLPIVSVDVVLRAGDARDPADKAGLASLTADLLMKGTRHRTAPQIAEAIDFVGGSLSTQSGADTAGASLAVLKKDLDAGMSLLADVLLEPSFQQAELDRLKDQYAAGLKSSLDDANEVIRTAFRQTVLKGHPYGRDTTLKSLKGITRADVQAFFTANYRPNNATIAVVGDVTPAEVRARLTRVLGKWQPHAQAAQAPLPALRTRTSKVVLVDMDVTQSFIMLGNMAVKRSHPDYYAISVLNFILGGDFTSRLNQSIRDRQGLAYGAGSRFTMFEQAGYFSASLNTKTETTAKALDSLLAETRRIQNEAISEQELDTAKAYLTGSFPLRFETNADLASELLNVETYGLGADFLSGYRSRIRAVTAADVQRVAKAYLQPGAYNLVVVGKAKGIGSQLKAFGQVETLPKESLIR